MDGADRAGFLAGEESAGVHAVAADVPEGAGAPAGLEAPVVRVDREGEGRTDESERADGSVVDQASQGGGPGLVPPHERLHQEDAARTAVFDHRLGLVGVQRQGLLAEDVLAEVGGEEDPGLVQLVGQGDVDGVDVGVGDGGLVGAVRCRDAELRGPGSGRLGVSAGDRPDGAGLRGADAGDQAASADPGAAEDRPLERSVGDVGHWGDVRRGRPTGEPGHHCTRSEGLNRTRSRGGAEEETERPHGSVIHSAAPRLRVRSRRGLDERAGGAHHEAEEPVRGGSRGT